MDTDKYKIIYKKPNDYENSTVSNSNLSQNDNISSNSHISVSSTNSDNSAELYVNNYSDKKITIHDNSKSDSDLNINAEIIFIKDNIDKFDDKDKINNFLINYFDEKKYTSEIKNKIVTGLKKYIEEYVNDFKNDKNNLSGKIPEIQQSEYTDKSNIQHQIEEFKKENNINSPDKDINTWLFYCAIFITLIIIMMVFIKKF